MVKNILNISRVCGISEILFHKPFFYIMELYEYGLFSHLQRTLCAKLYLDSRLGAFSLASVAVLPEDGLGGKENAPWVPTVKVIAFAFYMTCFV